METCKISDHDHESACCHSCGGHDRPVSPGEKLLNAFCLGAGTILFAAGLIFSFPEIYKLAVFLAAWLFFGWKVLLSALKNITRGKIFDENFLMSIATIGAFAIGEYPEGAAVMLFYRIGETFQDMAVSRSMRSISALMDLRPDYANLKRDGEIVQVDPNEVKAGDLIIVKPGEKIPLDGIVVSGFSALDTSALTGEAMPRDVEQGSEVLSGSINKNGLLEIQVTKEFGDSTVSRIFKLVKDAEKKKAPVENFITRFAAYYTPVVVFSAIALAVLPPLLIHGADFSHWIRRALVFLVVSCPCALVISIPLSFFGGIGGASRRGILVKGSNYLSALNDIDTVVFDKTGTLTKGKFIVSDVNPANSLTKEELLYYAAAAEFNSTHPIAKSISEANTITLKSDETTLLEEIPGRGVCAKVNGKLVLAGNEGFLKEKGVEFTAEELAGTLVYIALDGVYSGCIAINDELRDDSRSTITDLRRLGVRYIAMLTGDKKNNAEKICAELELDKIHADLLPYQKVEQLRLIKQQIKKSKLLAFAGDGINDAPALALSDIGIAMGGAGSDTAIEAADIVLMTDEPHRLVEAIAIAKKTRRIVWQNILFALGVKSIILGLGAFGLVTLWGAVFGDVGVALIAVFNAMRALRYNR